MMTYNGLLRKRLKEVLEYDKETGIFIWKIFMSNTAKAGDTAGTLHHRGYIHIRLDGVIYQAHRLAYLYIEGFMPPLVDHDNHVRNDNRWSNLKPSDSQANNRNRSFDKQNTTGILGVCYIKRLSKWGAKINVQGTCVWLGTYSDFFEACCARKSAELFHNFNKNHGASQCLIRKG